MHFETVAGAVVPLAGWASVVAAAAALLTDRAASIRNQRSSVILHCSLRYDALYEARAQIDGEPLEEPLPPVKDANPRVRAYFHRYFGLESDQIDFWLAGYVDPETMSSWFVSLVQNLFNGSVAGYSFKEGWRFVADHHRVVNPTMSEFVKEFLEGEEQLRIKPEADDEIYARIVRFMEVTEHDQWLLRWKLRKVFSSTMSARELTATLPEHLKPRVKALRRRNLKRA